MLLIKLPKRIILDLPSFIINYFYETVLIKSPLTHIGKEVFTNGIFVFEKKLKKDQITSLLQIFSELRNKNSMSLTGQSNGRISSQKTLHPYLNKILSPIIPYAKDILGSRNIKLELNYFQESNRENLKENVPGGDLHVDDNKANIKYFIYLTDVSKNNGPFKYLPKSSRWRLKNSFLRGLMWAITKKRSSLYSMFINNKIYNSKMKTYIGKAGTHFLVDTTGLHSASFVKDKKRIVFVASFNRI